MWGSHSVQNNKYFGFNPFTQWYERSRGVPRTILPFSPSGGWCLQADAAPKKRAFKKFQYRGVDLDALLDYSTEKFTEMLNARQRRKASRTVLPPPVASHARHGLRRAVPCFRPLASRGFAGLCNSRRQTRHPLTD